MVGASVERDVSDRLQRSSMIEPVDPFEHVELDGFEDAPWPAPPNDRDCVEPVDRLGETFPIADRDISHAVIAVKHKAAARAEPLPASPRRTREAVREPRDVLEELKSIRARWPRSLQCINIEAEAVGRSLVRDRKQELSYGKPARTLSPMASKNFSRHHK
jgi:hypothetical protein